MMDADLIQVGVKLLTNSLYEGYVRVTFTKKDGSERVMVCTKQLGLIPEEKHPKPKSQESVIHEDFEIEDSSPRDPQLITVFDVEKQDWRSFRYTTVKNVEVTDRASI